MSTFDESLISPKANCFDSIYIVFASQVAEPWFHLKGKTKQSITPYLWHLFYFLMKTNCCLNQWIHTQPITFYHYNLHIDSLFHLQFPINSLSNGLRRIRIGIKLLSVPVGILFSLMSTKSINPKLGFNICRSIIPVCIHSIHTNVDS